MHLPTLSLALIPLISTLTAAVLIVETSTSTYTAAAATSSPPSSSSTSTSTPTTTTTPTPASIQYTSDTAFESSILNTTNTYRAHHNATALLWNASLATTASSWATQCRFNHSHSAAGENLAQDYANVTAAVEAWGDEGRRYDYHKETYSESTGHFSQLVWKGTASVGCGRVECGGRGGVRGWFVVCEYWPKGNIEGMFGEEVGGVVGLWVVDGDREVGEGLARVVAEVNGGGAGRRGGLRFGCGWGLGVVVGVGMLGALGL